MRQDQVLPEVLGLNCLRSEDSVLRAFASVDARSWGLQGWSQERRLVVLRRKIVVVPETLEEMDPLFEQPSLPGLVLDEVSDHKAYVFVRHRPQEAQWESELSCDPECSFQSRYDYSLFSNISGWFKTIILSTEQLDNDQRWPEMLHLIFRDFTTQKRRERLLPKAG